MWNVVPRLVPNFYFIELSSGNGHNTVLVCAISYRWHDLFDKMSKLSSFLYFSWCNYVTDQMLPELSYGILRVLIIICNEMIWVWNFLCLESILRAWWIYRWHEESNFKLWYFFNVSNQFTEIHVFTNKNLNGSASI